MAAGRVRSTPTARHEPTPWPWPAEYWFGGQPEAVLVVAFTAGGEPVVRKADGSVFVSSSHRVKLLDRQQLS